VAVARQALTANPLGPEQVKYLIGAIPDYPVVENTWQAAGAPPPVKEIMERAGLQRDDVSAPYMLILATAVQLKMIDLADIPRPPAKTDPFWVITLANGARVTIQAPPGTTVTGTLNEEPINWTSPEPGETTSGEPAGPSRSDKALILC
jgi:hypothetical protein